MSNAALSWARAQRGMTPAAKAVLMVLADCANGDRLCWPSQQVIADDCCIRRQAIPGIIARLVEIGLIETRRTGKENQYTLLLDVREYRTTDVCQADTADVREPDNAGHTSPLSGQRMSELPTTDVREPDTNPKEPSRTQSTPPIVPPAKRGGRLLDGFEDWWRDYPHKVGKGAAERAWPKALALAKGVDLAAAVRRYIEGKPADRPWCNPATWLNQRRWEDQEAGSLNGTSHGPQGPPPKPEELWPDLMNGERLH